MPTVTEEATIFCVDFPQQIVTTGIWTGVSLSTLLAKAGVQPTALKVGFFAADGYATDLDLTTATSASVLVAYAKDGAPLGESLRLVVPGRWGYKWISQLTTITLYDYDFKGKWENQGYSDEATFQSGGGSQNRPTGQSFPNPVQPSSPAPTPSIPTPNASTTEPQQEPQQKSPSADPQPADYTTPMLEFAAIATAVVIACASLLILIRRRHHLQANITESGNSALLS